MPDDAWGLGAQVGDYRLEASLGAGAMGQVYRARHLPTGALRALKRLAPGSDELERERFLREGQAIARLEGHPHVLEVHAAGVHAGEPYLVLQLAAGGSLAERLRAGPLAPEEARALGQQLAGALAYVHGAGVVHRDLKPDNVLFDERGRPLLADFGVARLDDATRLTRTADVTGTPLYMAPEVARGATEPASDVYSLGALLYECLSGRPPIEARGGVLATLDAISREAPAPLRQLAPGVPAWLDEACLSALAKEPGERPSAAAFAELLARGDALQGRSLLLPLALALALLAAAALALSLALEARGERGRPSPSLAARSPGEGPRPSRSPAPELEAPDLGAPDLGAPGPGRGRPYLDTPARVIAYARSLGDAEAYAEELRRARASFAPSGGDELTRLLTSSQPLTPAQQEELWLAFCNLRRGLSAPNLWVVLCDHLSQRHWEPLPYLGQILVMISGGRNQVGEFLQEEAALRAHPHALTRLGEPGVGPLAESFRRAQQPLEQAQTWLALLERLRPEAARSPEWRQARALVRQGALPEALALYRRLFARSRGQPSEPLLALELSQVARYRWNLELGSPRLYDADEGPRRAARAQLEAWRSELQGLLAELTCVEVYAQLSLLEQRVGETWGLQAVRERREAFERGIQVMEVGLERFPGHYDLLLRGAHLHKLVARVAPARAIEHLRASLRLIERVLLLRRSERWELFRQHRERDLHNLERAR